jgi:hypothetical protein
MDTRTQLQTDLEQHILHGTSRRVRELAVELVSEAVVLKGRTASYYVKQLAQQGVRDLLPLIRLHNAIVVESAN